MVEIYINNKLIDLSGDENIEADYSIFDISKIGSRGGARSYSFTVPKTNRNRTVFDSAEIVNNLSALPYQRLGCLVLVDGVDVQIRFCELESIKEGYSLRLYGSNSDLFASIKDLTWEDLAIALSVYDHFWDMETIVASRQNTEGFIYPLIDFHSDSPNAWINNDNNYIRVEGLLPCFFYNTLLEIIIEYFGYDLVNEIAEDTANLIISDGLPKGRNHDVRRYNATFGTLPASFTGALNQIGVDALLSTDGTYFVAGTYAQYDNFNPAIVFVDNVKLRVTAKYFMTNNTGIDSVVTLYARYSDLNNTFQYSTPISFTIPANASFYEINVDYNMDDILIKRSGTGIADAPYIDFWGDGNNAVVLEPTGSYIQIETVELYNEDLSVTDSNNQVTTYVAHPQIIFDTDLIDNTHLFNYITASTMFPNLKPMDVVKNYLMMFGLIPIISEITNTVTLIKFDKILSNIGSADDWSDKIDFTEEPELKFVLTEYAQKNKFEYATDGEELKPAGTDGEILINNKNLPLEANIVELDFAATNKVTRLVDLSLSQIGWFKELSLTEDKVPRVLINQLYTGNINYSDSVLAQETNVTTDIPIPYFIDSSKQFNLGFTNNLIPNYYDLLTSILSRAKILTESVRLNAADINQLDFSKPVWIDRHESFFYKSAVKGFPYTESRSTTVELVKLNIHA